jgi:streptogrisin C
VAVASVIVVLGSVTALAGAWQARSSAGGGAKAAGSESPRAQPSPSPSLDPTKVTGSVAYLRQAYGISEEEALRRLILQDTARSLAAKFTSTAADTYGGMWLDQAHGGRLVIASTSPPAADSLLNGIFDRAHIDVHTATYSLQDLEQTQQRLASQLGTGPNSVLLPAISETTNQVILWRRDWLPGQSAKVNTANQIVRSEGGKVALKTLPRPKGLFAPHVNVGSCQPLYCTGYGPMRGGIRLDIQRDDGSWGGCTSGFNVRATGGSYAGQAFVLTAGHCILASRHTHTDQPFHNGDRLLREVSKLAVNSFPYDFAFMPYTNATVAKTWLDKWPQRNLVLTTCPKNSGTSCKSSDLAITGVRPFSGVVSGEILCSSGSASSSANYPKSWDSGSGAGYQPGTHCGRVTGTDVAINTDICTRAGDSGGPLFNEVDGVAYGILEGNRQDREGTCKQGENNNFTPVSMILDYLNAQPAASGSTFNVITSAQG